MLASNFNLISNNFQGLKLSEKRIKLFEPIKSKLAPSVFFLLWKLIHPRKSNKNGNMNWMNKYFWKWEIQFVWCFYSFSGSKSVIITKEISDKNGRKLLLQVKVDDEIYLLINLYSSNTESEQLYTLHELEAILLKSDANECNHITVSGYFNIFLTLPWKQQQVEMLN